ncbi:uncharacterized protein LOC126330072 [Schistocerca gregaria]|uniref:uncharacterized protein LOC126330072 n=1 Tax=Schistocerca gregaria TaxID=7010 RepID=UPI00211EC15B|nr:uncharacterized protein LOC126330072 [Schistocerca gregaria]XP_049852273.1 uncharacterized protein LOC126330072 [Schistocerca gregaria]XP_049852275.1 uncharacterized protein LOC126330072 [Schistocerca gregaria]XP_049852276.1 uncharacterized protein LOC126330072 [Schistocerca gregaria]
MSRREVEWNEFAEMNRDCVKRAKLSEGSYLSEGDELCVSDSETSQAGDGPDPLVPDEVDPLDAFMEDLNEALSVQRAEAESLGAGGGREGNRAGQREEIMVEEDHMESFVKQRAMRLAKEEKQGQAQAQDDLEYDSDDNPVVRKRMIELLPVLNHSEIVYEDFKRDFYKEDPEISAQSEEEVNAQRKRMDVRVEGTGVCRPVLEFEQLGFDSILLKTIQRLNFTELTPIQKQAIPMVLSGRDLIGVAKTGSGKTAAFVWPMLVHLINQRGLSPGEGPIAVIVSPTRELAMQTYDEVRKFGKGYGVRAVPVVGGIGRGEVRRMLKMQPCEVVVATPGRLIETFKNKLISNMRITYFVLDEADKMFDMGFEPQVRSISGQIRPDRQTLLFSATFKPAIEQLAREILHEPVRITIGKVGTANEDITQVAEIFDSDNQKWPWICMHIRDFILDGSVLIFAGSKVNVEELSKRLLSDLQIPSVALHGDCIQEKRLSMIHAYKQQKVKVMFATDIAARGLDVKCIRTVVNYVPTRDIDSHIHRIGRTGRAGNTQGIAYTLLTKNESHFAGLLLENFIDSKQDIPEELVQLALEDPKFKKKIDNLPYSKYKKFKPYVEKKASAHQPTPASANHHQSHHHHPRQHQKRDFSTPQASSYRPLQPQLFVKSSQEYTNLADDDAAPATPKATGCGIVRPFQRLNRSS